MLVSCSTLCACGLLRSPHISMLVVGVVLLVVCCLVCGGRCVCMLSLV